MHNILFIIAVAALIGILPSYAHSQEMNLATFQETAQIIIDKSISQKVTASITLQSTSIQEIKIPAELEQRIREDGRISAITITNQDQCVLGVENEGCILINVKRDAKDSNFLEIQNSTLKVAEQFIGKVNETFDTNARQHSTFINTNDESSIALGTSGVISGKGTISAVYTMPIEDTASMYEKISAILIPKVIRDSGGFYKVGKELSTLENSKMTFSIIPVGNKSLMQLRVSTDYPEEASNITRVSPLDFLNSEKLDRSGYFSSGFYPLNSIIQVVVLSPENITVSNINGNVLATQIIENERIPTDISKDGWVFDPDNGKRIQGKYIFGDSDSIDKEDLEFTVGEIGQETSPEKTETDESIVIVIISIAAIAAASYYLKGYKR